MKMNFNTINIKNKNLPSSINKNSSSESKNISKKISPNLEKNINDINANKNILTNLIIKSNEITQNKSSIKKNNQILINSELINIDESAYNPDLFVLPKKI